MRTRLIVIAAVDLLLLGGGFALSQVDSVGNASISWSVGAIGIVTLLGLLAGSGLTTKVTTQFALTVSVAAVWFASVGSLLFFVEEEGPLAGDAFNGVSIVMGVVVSFYFGTKAYESVGKERAKSQGDTDPAPATTRSHGNRGGASTDDPRAPSVEIYD